MSHNSAPAPVGRRPSLSLCAIASLRDKPPPANDNRPTLRHTQSPANDALAGDMFLGDALRLFAARGLGAARHAAECAMHAIAEGDRNGFVEWLGICRTLDRRLAATLVARYGIDGRREARR
ncbi:hypothetical protein ACFO0A_15185 [Novosphingobium tardum]|uniref:Uncharacterized protein n=1 Tax=Novosphingobium tardum TaxID=1538021 RepID=A0ABV8RTA1_9SPHN